MCCLIILIGSVLLQTIACKKNSSKRHLHQHELFSITFKSGILYSLSVWEKIPKRWRANTRPAK